MVVLEYAQAIIFISSTVALAVPIPINFKRVEMGAVQTPIVETKLIVWAVMITRFLFYNDNHGAQSFLAPLKMGDCSWDKKNRSWSWTMMWMSVR